MPDGPRFPVFRPVATANAALVAGTWQPVDATSGNITLALPTGLSRVGVTITVERVDIATANTVTITGKIRGVASSSITLRTAGSASGDLLTFIYEGNDSWRPGPAHRPKTINDSFYEPIGAAAAAMTTHTGATDPHPQYAKVSEKAQPGGLATLGSDGKVPSAQMPVVSGSVASYANLAAFPATGVTGTIYIAQDTNQLYRWTGTAYVSVGSTSGSGTVTSVAGKQGTVTLVKADVGLGNVDNTADTAKPISTAVQAALDLKLNASARNAANGVAGLDGSGLVPAALLPSYVDDVLEYANQAAFPATGETGKLYVSLATGRIYRWSGSAYVEIAPSPGSTDSVPEGSTNLYYTNARVAAYLAANGFSAGGGVTEIIGLQGMVTNRASLPTVSGTVTAPNGLTYGGVTYTAGDLVGFNTSASSSSAGGVTTPLTYDGKIYVVSSGTWAESTSYNTATMKSKKLFYVEKGPNVGKYYLFDNAGVSSVSNGLFVPLAGFTQDGFLLPSLLPLRLQGGGVASGASGNIDQRYSAGDVGFWDIGAATSGTNGTPPPQSGASSFGPSISPQYGAGSTGFTVINLDGFQLAAAYDATSGEPVIFVRAVNGLADPSPAFSAWQKLVTMQSVASRAPVTVTPSGSPFVYTNTSQHTMQVTTAGGTVSNVEKAHDGTTYVSMHTATGSTLLLLPGESIRWTYTAAPTVRRQAIF